MKLTYKIASKTLLALLIILPIWAILFYFAIMNEITDEVDDNLEEYSKEIIKRSLSGEEITTAAQLSNNSYGIVELPEQEAVKMKGKMTFSEKMIYIDSKQETEPARILKTTFKNQDKWYLLTVYTPTIEKKDLKEAILFWIIFLYIILLLTMLIINIFIFKKSMKPLYVLLKWLDNYKVGTNNTNLDNNTDITEFQRLNAAAVNNAARTEQTFEQQKQFIGNASHEIQTPVAICLNRVELLMNDSNTSESQLENLIKLQQTLLNISKLNKALLLLTKIDNNQFSSTATVNFNDIIKLQLEDFEDAYSYKNININLNTFSTFTININDSLAYTLTSNLIKNAYVHNNIEGNIDISIYSDKIIFSNSGLTQPLDAEHIFERFYNSSYKEGSTGLGLAIAKAICKTYSLSLTYLFTNDKHVFTLQKILK